MKQWREKLKNLSEEEINLLLATFVASMLGIMSSEIFSRLGYSVVTGDGFGVRFLISLGATLMCVLAAGTTFYVLAPQSRPAFQKIWQRIRRK